MNKYLIIFLTVFLTACTSSINSKCSYGVNIELCLPNNLQPISDPNNSFKVILPVLLEKTDKDYLKKNNFNKIQVDNQLSKMWNSVLKDVKADTLKNKAILETVMRDKFPPFLKFSVDNKNNIEANFLGESFISQIKQSSPKPLDDKDFRNLRKDFSKLEKFYEKNGYLWLDMLYLQSVFYDFYANNQKKVYILADTSPDTAPFGILNGDLYIPKPFLTKINSDELYVTLIHEAFHFFMYNQSVLEKVMSQLSNKKTIDILAESALVFDKVKNKEKIDPIKLKEAEEKLSSFGNTIGGFLSCFSKIGLEFQIDRSVVLYLKDKQVVTYRNLLNSVISENGVEKEKIRVDLIDALAEYVAKYNKENLIKELAYSGIIQAMNSQQKTAFSDRYVYMTNSDERDFMKKYSKIQFESGRLIEEFKNKFNSENGCLKTL